MLISGSGRHRRTRPLRTRRLATAAVIAGAGLVLPLFGADAAMAAPAAGPAAAHQQWRGHQADEPWYSQGLGHRHRGRGHRDAAPAGGAPTAAPAPSWVPAPSPTPTATPSATASPTASPTALASAPATPAAASTPASSTTAGSDAVSQVLALINKARAAQGLPAYTVTAGLTSSAGAHNQVMAGGCGLSHQCAGEAAIGARESAAGVRWTSAGENIGEGGPVSTATQDIAAMAVRLTQDMLDEKPPNDGHRQNLLSSGFTHIGIAVYRDAQGTVWLTQDFSD